MTKHRPVFSTAVHSSVSGNMHFIRQYLHMQIWTELPDHRKRCAAEGNEQGISVFKQTCCHIANKMIRGYRLSQTGRVGAFFYTFGRLNSVAAASLSYNIVTYEKKRCMSEKQEGLIVDFILYRIAFSRIDTIVAATAVLTVGATSICFLHRLFCQFYLNMTRTGVWLRDSETTGPTDSSMVPKGLHAS